MPCDIVAEARRNGTTVHLGRIFEACYEKGFEFPESDPRRKFKGRTVFQGNNVRDENSDHVLFNELGSSPASMEAAKLLDAFGSQPGFSKQQADAMQAYIQAFFTGVPTWLSSKQMATRLGEKVLAAHGTYAAGSLWSSGQRGYLGQRPICRRHGQASKQLVDIGDPDAYDRYFGCTHREFQNIRLPSQAHPFAFAFEAKKSAVAQHRAHDWWEHDTAKQAWTRHHVQPRKRLYQQGDEGERVLVKFQFVLLSLTKRSHSKVVLASPTGTIRGATMSLPMFGKLQAIKQMSFGLEKLLISVMDRMDQTSSSSLQWQAWQTRTPSRQTRSKERGESCQVQRVRERCEAISWRHGQARESCEV